MVLKCLTYSLLLKRTKCCCFQSGKYDVPKWLSSSAIQLLSLLLQVDPKRRITVNQLRHHEWLVKGFGEPVISFASIKV